MMYSTVGDTTCITMTRNEPIQVQLATEKARLNHRLKTECPKRQEQKDNDNTKVCSADGCSCPSIMNENTATTATTRTSCCYPNNDNKKNNKKTVRFHPFDQTMMIESRQNMSNKEIRKYWWSFDEISDMKPDYKSLKRLHQNCGTEDCIRGLESSYWTIKTMEEGDFRPDNKDFAIFVQEFLRPPTSFIKHGSDSNSKNNSDYGSKNDNDNKNNQNCSKDMTTIQKDSRIYRNHVILSQQRARLLALMDEAYVKEHVYGLSCSHLDIIKDDKWNYLRCCNCSNSKNCHKRESSSTSSSSSSNQDSSYLGKFVQGVRRRVSGNGRKIHSHAN